LSSTAEIILSHPTDKAVEFNAVPTHTIATPHPIQSTDVLTVGNRCDDIVVTTGTIPEVDAGVRITRTGGSPLGMGRQSRQHGAEAKERSKKDLFHGREEYKRRRI